MATDQQLSARRPITVAAGDGIGPEITEATLRVLEAAEARLDVETIEVGERVYRKGFSTGIEPRAWESIRRTGVLLKGPIMTPQGGGWKSLNVTIRKTLGLFANVRPCRSFHPFVETHHPDMNLVIIRENEEDLYSGIEHRQTQEVYQCLKLVSRAGSERLIRYAFEYARARGRKKLSCLTKDNIMKLTDGLFHRIFRETAKEYPDLETEHLIVDIGMARVADNPERFDVVVCPNLYGDILSDIAAELTGSVGMAGSANIGETAAMFEAIHGSAPDIAGQGVANPSGMILASVSMLAHIGQPDVSERIHNAWIRTVEDGVHTRDIFGPRRSVRLASTAEFAQAVIDRLGEMPRAFNPVHYLPPAGGRYLTPLKPQRKELVGVDIFVDDGEHSAEDVAARLQAAETPALALGMITNRGVRVWPEGAPETFCVDHWRCRFQSRNGVVRHADVLEVLGRLASSGVDFIKTEHLYTFDGEPGFSLGQGE